MAILSQLTLDQLGDLTLDDLGTLYIDGFNFTVVVPAGQVSEDIAGFLLYVPVPNLLSVSVSSGGVTLDTDIREAGFVVQVDLKAEEDNILTGVAVV